MPQLPAPSTVIAFMHALPSFAPFPSEPAHVGAVPEQDERARAAAAATTARGAPVHHATGGRASVAAIDPSDTYRVIQTVRRNSPAATAVANGERTLKTPAATATPLPPWNRSQTG